MQAYNDLFYKYSSGILSEKEQIQWNIIEQMKQDHFPNSATTTPEEYSQKMREDWDEMDKELSALHESAKREKDIINELRINIDAEFKSWNFKSK